MRRWVCVIAMLGGFMASDYAASARVRERVPIERRLEDAGSTPRRRAAGARIANGPTVSWWRPAWPHT